MAASAAGVLHPFNFAQNFGKSRACPELVEGAGSLRFSNGEYLDLQLESDGFEETQVRLRFVVPTLRLQKRETQGWDNLSLC